MKYHTNGNRYISKTIPTEIAHAQRNRGFRAKIIQESGYWKVYTTNPNP